MTNETSYSDILKRNLAERCQANPRYSLRAFARDLGMSPGRLSSVINGKLGLSEKAALELARKLGFEAAEARRFADLVLATDSRSKRTRRQAMSRIEEYQTATSDFLSMELEAFKVISDWHHFAILELTTLKRFKPEAPWIAGRLGISRYEAETAVARLLKLGLLERRDGKLVCTEANLTTGSGVPSEAIRNFHSQVLRKAQEALALQSVDERDFTSLTVAIDAADLPLFRKSIGEFRKSVNAQAEARKSGRNEVYCLGIQFFRLTNKENA